VSLSAVPLTPARAQLYVSQFHRHHGPLPPGYAAICIGAVRESVLVGVSIVGRPTNRNNDDGQTVEVLRLATDESRNAPSFLLGASARAAKAIGAWRIITYTLDSESGVSLKAAGWVHEEAGIKSWWTHQSGQDKGRIVRAREHYAETKSRWVCYFAEGPVKYDAPTPAGLQQESLFA
jgi:hypothetical protein